MAAAAAAPGGPARRLAGIRGAERGRRRGRPGRARKHTATPQACGCMRDTLGAQAPRRGLRSRPAGTGERCPQGAACCGARALARSRPAPSAPKAPRLVSSTLLDAMSPCTCAAASSAFSGAAGLRPPMRPAWAAGRGRRTQSPPDAGSPALGGAGRAPCCSACAATRLRCGALRSGRPARGREASGGPGPSRRLPALQACACSAGVRGRGRTRPLGVCRYASALAMSSASTTTSSRRGRRERRVCSSPRCSARSRVPGRAACASGRERAPGPGALCPASTRACGPGRALGRGRACARAPTPPARPHRLAMLAGPFTAAPGLSQAVQRRQACRPARAHRPRRAPWRRCSGTPAPGPALQLAAGRALAPARGRSRAHPARRPRRAQAPRARPARPRPRATSRPRRASGWQTPPRRRACGWPTPSGPPSAARPMRHSRRAPARPGREPASAPRRTSRAASPGPSQRRKHAAAG